MNVSIGERWEDFVNSAVKTGRYNSASEVVREGLRLVEERESKLFSLRKIINSSIDKGGYVTEDMLQSELDARSLELKRAGY